MNCVEMCSKRVLLFTLIFLILVNEVLSVRRPGRKMKRSKMKRHSSDDEEKSSLAFVFDTTGSMHDDLKQLRQGAEMILRTALEHSNFIGDFVFVPFHDPGFGPPTVTKDKAVFKAALNIVRVYGGGDCPEMSLSGIQMALNVSRPRSFLYVFTDATAYDHGLVNNVLDAVQRKQSQVVFVLTGHCNDLDRPSYKVYHQIAAASSGQVFNLNKTNVHEVLRFVRNSVKGRSVNLGSAVLPAGRNFSQAIPVDSTVGEVTVSVSGARPKIKVINPSGEEITGPPKLITTLDLSEIMVVKVMQPEPGNWNITVGSDKEYSVKVAGLSNMTFEHGFSVVRPASMAETSYRPLQDAYNHLLVALTPPEKQIDLDYVEILNLEGKTMFEVPLREVDKTKKTYLADAFVPPNDFFYIAINGHDDAKQELRRIGPTAVQAKSPDVPYLTASRKIEARSHARVILKCYVESLVPVTAKWVKDSVNLQPEISSLQTTSIQYDIHDMSEGDAGVYTCQAKNVAGLSTADTEVVLLVDPPQVTIQPGNKTLDIGEELLITCTVWSEVLPKKFQLLFNGNETEHSTNIEPSAEGSYVYNKIIRNVTEKDGGVYTCASVNRGGSSNQSTHIIITAKPTTQILGPHSVTKLMNTELQLVCRVENANKVQWLAPNGTVVANKLVNGTSNEVLNVNATSDGFWSCIGFRGKFNASDAVEVNIQIKPKVSIQGSKNVTVLNGTIHEVVCEVMAKPTPRILWHRETEKFLNNTIIPLQNNVYRSTLTLNSSRERVNGTYFCFGENSEGIDQDSLVVSVRRKMILLEGFGDNSVDLYSQIEFQCITDSYPHATITWFHNGTEVTSSSNVHMDNSVLYIKRVNFEDLGDYSCVANNGFESIDVNGTLSVGGLESPEILKAKSDQTAQMGKSTKITCRILKGNPAPSIQWKFKAETSEDFTTLPNNTRIDEEDNLLIVNVTSVHEGVYRCVAVNVIGVDQHDVGLVVQYPPKLITSEEAGSNHHEVKAGDEVKFSCKAEGSPKPIIVWTKDKDPVVYSKNVYLSTDNELVIQNATLYDIGRYICTATNTLGAARKNFTLYVYVPPQITHEGVETSQELLEGQLVELPCSVQGEPKPRVEWQHNGVAVNKDRKFIDEFGLRFVANLTDFGNYTCFASNPFGNTSLTYAVYIWVPPHISPPMEVLKDALLGDNVALQCDVVGFPIPDIRWEYLGTPVVENTTDVSFNNVGNLYITNVTSRHEGIYDCVAENFAGGARKSFYVRVNEPPKILEDNYTGPYLATDMDSFLTIACIVRGRPQPLVRWSKDDFFLDKDFRYDVTMDGRLIIKSPTEDLSGNYTCSAKNPYGEVNKTVEVKIYPLPSRMQSDETHTNAVLLEGSNATVTCPIRTSASDTVKWYKEAKLITTGNFILTNVSRTNASTYACVVTNAVGSAHAALTVTVAWPPSFKDAASDAVDVVRGDDLYLSCEVDAKPAAKIRWLFNSKPLVFEDKERLKLINVQTHNNGSYKCVASNAHGTITRTYNLNVLVPPFISEFDTLDVLLKENVNATLECKAKGTPPPTIRWTYNNTYWQLENGTLSSTNTSAVSEGLYRCDASNMAGSAHIVYRVTVVSAPRVGEVTAFADGEGATVDRAVEVVLNSNVRMACQASGKPAPTIQWLRNGQVVGENRPGIDYADLVLSDVQPTHAGVYTCIATNEGGSGERKVKLEVLEPPKIFHALFQNTNASENTINLEVLSGQAFYLHCHPYGNPLPEVYWFKDDLPLMLYDDTMVSTEFGEVIVVKSAVYEQSANYTCVAKNKVGNSSISYLVDVLVPPPKPKETSKEVTAVSGKLLHLVCPVEGSPLPEVMWVKHPYTEISKDTSRVSLIDEEFAMVINETEISDSGKYSCIMTNKVGTTEVVFNVTVYKPPSIAGNVGSNIIEGHVVPLRRSIVLKCEVEGHPTPKITWLKDTQYLTSSSHIHRVLGNSLLAVWGAAARDAGQYICVAENDAGTAHRRYNLAVQVPGKWSAWSQWSLCNVTCGLGYQERDRFCHYIDDNNNTIDHSTQSEKIILDESACKGPANEKRKCHMPACEDDGSKPKWSVWSRWSSCSASCGVGTQAQTRRCKSKAKCSGDNVQIRKCPGLPKCPDRQHTETNDVFDESNEKTSDNSNETNPYLPEAVYEMQPEVIKSIYSPDVEEFYIASTERRSTVFYDVNVTTNLDHSERGPCDPGYRHNTTFNSCDDIDECLLDNNHCHSTQVCVNTEGAYRCTCPPGYVSLGLGQRCLDINECEQDIHGCEYACVNVAGGYVCACPRHLRLHIDRHHCVMPASYQHPYEDLDSSEYLSASFEYPTKYTKSTKRT